MCLTDDSENEIWSNSGCNITGLKLRVQYRLLTRNSQRVVDQPDGLAKARELRQRNRRVTILRLVDAGLNGRLGFFRAEDGLFFFSPRRSGVSEISVTPPPSAELKYPPSLNPDGPYAPVERRRKAKTTPGAVNPGGRTPTRLASARLPGANRKALLQR